jgi:hypothetical protein
VVVLTRSRKPAKRSKLRPNEAAGGSPATMYVVFILEEAIEELTTIVAHISAENIAAGETLGNEHIDEAMRIDALPRLRDKKTASSAKAGSRELPRLLPSQRTRKGHSNRLFRPWRTNKIGDDGSPVLIRLAGQVQTGWDIVYDFSTKEPSAIGPRLEKSNPSLQGSTPLQGIETGESDRVWRIALAVARRNVCD